MEKKRIKQTVSGTPLAAKIIAKMKRTAQGKVVDIGEAARGRAMAEELHQTVISDPELAGFHPAHAAYVYAQNQVVAMTEQLSALKEMAPILNIISGAEDLYMPGGPPMSPLTNSYFNLWAFFDACVGSANETLGTTILEIGSNFGMHSELWRVIRLLQDSRMSLFIHQGKKRDLATLEELVTGEVCHALVPAGYLGQKGELWYARVLPPPIQRGSEYVVLTTPYIVLQPGLDEWMAYIRRTCPAVEDFKHHMKYGPTRAYWNDFVLEAYVNYRTEAVYLAGLPDVPESRPHSKVNS